MYVCVVHMYVVYCAGVCGCTCPHIHVKRPERRLGVLVHHCQPYSLETVSLTEPELGWQPARPSDAQFSVLNSAGGMERVRLCLALYVQAGDPIPGPHTGTPLH